jgi:hypothetical protein
MTEHLITTAIAHELGLPVCGRGSPLCLEFGSIELTNQSRLAYLT